MKRLFTLLLIGLISSFTLIAQTNVSGIITTNTTWASAGSPYIVTSSITINNDVTLTIESGVTVKFNDNQYLFALGTLDANNVVFTASNTTPASGIWGYIQVGNSTHEGFVTLDNCEIQYSQTLRVERGTATLTNSNISNSSQNGVVVYADGSLSMTGGNISGIGQSGVYLSDGSIATLDGVNISNAASNGVVVYNLAELTYSNGSISSTPTGLNLQTDAIANLNSVSISSASQYGIYLRQNSQLNLTDATISLTGYPIHYAEASNVTLGGTNSFTDNTNNFVNIAFYNIPINMTLPSYPIPVHIQNAVTVNTGYSFTIGSNNILKFANSSSLTVNGTLVAEAIEGESIYFTLISDDNWGGDSNKDGSNSFPSPNYWYGIVFNNSSNDANSVIRRAKIRYSGAGYYGGITMFDASPTIDQCEISNSYYGIVLNNASNPTISNTTIGSSQMTPIAMSFEANPTFTNNVLSFSDNQYDAVGLLGGTLTANANIKQRSFTGIDNISYLMLGKIIVPSSLSLTIDPGVVIKGESNYNIVVYGTLIAEGTPEEKIVFTSARDDNHGNPLDTNKDGTTTTPQIGNFGGIFLAEGSSLSTLSNVITKYSSAQGESINFTSGGSKWFEGNASVVVIKSSPTITNSEISNAYHGIWGYENSEPTISSNNMVNITYTPFGVTPSTNPAFTNNTFTNCGWNAVGLIGGDMTLSGTIRKRTISGFENITYVLLHNLTIAENTYIDIEPGVVIKLEGKKIVVNGGFKAVGTLSEPIVFTSISDDNVGNPGDTNGDGNATAPAAGNWINISFQPASDDAYNTFNNVQLKYGGYYYYPYGIYDDGIIETVNASPTIQSVLIEQSNNYGISLKGNSAIIMDGVTIQNCSFEPVAMSLTSNPSFANMIFTANRNKGLRIIEGTLSSNATLISRDVAGITNIAYIVGNLTIAENATLTINPGVVIKMEYMIYVDGALIANGTESQKIIFTSLADDSAGGDTNDDGNTTVPNKGNWYGIVFRASGIAATNSLTHSILRYANYTVQYENSYAYTEYNTIELSSGNAFQIFGSSNPVIKNNQLFNINETPVYMSMFAAPTFEGNTMANIGITAISIKPETFSQDATIPQRSFAGYNNITYYLLGEYIVNSGTTITIPAGTVFKTNKYYYSYSYHTAKFTVNGKLLVEGTAENPVVFTHYYDDLFGNPTDIGNDGNTPMPTGISNNWFTFNDVSNDESSINYAIIKSIGGNSIELKSAAPTITNSWFEGMSYGIVMTGVSEPNITTNTFHNLSKTPMSLSLVAYPTTATGNTISGTTYKAIRINDETLTQDITLPKRDFGGTTNIPYMFGYYTVGTGAVLTIDPGVIIKFEYYGYIDVYKGLIALGGESLDQKIVFTSITDDFYGGDTNSDGMVTSAESSQWRGITFYNESLDQSCTIDHAIFRYSGHGWNRGAIEIQSASPTISNSSFFKGFDGITVAGSSNPVISGCDFLEITNIGVNNIDQTFTIEATNSWWGNNTGPTHANNPNGDGVVVSDAVNYIPFATNGMLSPTLGDPSLNGKIQAFDASQILQNVVGSLTFDTRQTRVADVSGNGSITAYDASKVLQYVVGLINYFEPEVTKKSSEGSMGIGSPVSEENQLLKIPVYIQANNANSLQAQITYDPLVVKVKGVEFGETIKGFTQAAEFGQQGIISLAAANASAIDLEGEFAYILLEPATTLESATTTALGFANVYVNDGNITALSQGREITVTPVQTAIEPIEEITSLSVFPNPARESINIRFSLNQSENVRVEIISIIGQTMAVLTNQRLEAGNHTLNFSLNAYNLRPGIYLVKVGTGNNFSAHRLQVSK
ncbi:MAG: right-handed parallel beta-helix repeat-containing protein [Tenuifilaceae bacterium]|nr:right-handed parallel beta-helix repeat-containing protein [Tenuifilaceae bacterium]